MNLYSPAFVNRASIPAIYTADGHDLSPPLAWDDAPENTAEFALLCDDRDAKTFPAWVHWILYKIPSSWRELHEGLGSGTGQRLAGGLMQGLNSWHSDNVGYRGPAPPPRSGMHHYTFHLYALNEPLDLPPQATRHDFMHAIHGKVIAEAQLMGTYER